MLGDLIRVGWNKAKAVGGGASGYFDDSSRIAETRAFDTPFLRALQVVDRRDGHIVQLKNTWRALAITAAVIGVGGYAGWAYQAHLGTVEWLVVPIDKFGEPGEISIPAVFVPSTAQKAERVREVIKAMFALSSDPNVNRENYDFLSRTLFGKAIKTANSWIKENRADLSVETRVEIVTIKPAGTGDTLNVIWKESDFKEGVAVYPTRRMNGDFTLKYIKPKTRVEAQRNVLGIWVTDMVFAQEGSR